jgi:UDP-N-acetylmuramate dehydrogenase
MLDKNVDLKPYNTFGISVKANYFAAFQDVSSLGALLHDNSEKNITILGGGSNVLFTKNYDGLILRNEIKGTEIVKEEDNFVYVKSGAGENWHEFVLYCIDNNLGGIENLSLIPGSVGASPMQNIGAYGVEIKDVFYELEAFNIETGEVETFSHPECEFGYRESVFKKALKGKYVITSVTFRLTKNHKLNTSYGAINSELEAKGIKNPTIKEVSDSVIAIRQSKLPDPKQIGNAGSFFKNPVVDKNILAKIQEKYPEVPSYPIDDNHVKLPAGWLIDTAGWKGKRIADYGVHSKQALVLVNYNDATGMEIYALSQEILDDIQNKFGVLLEREVNIV